MEEMLPPWSSSLKRRREEVEEKEETVVKKDMQAGKSRVEDKKEIFKTKSQSVPASPVKKLEEITSSSLPSSALKAPLPPIPLLTKHPLPISLRLTTFPLLSTSPFHQHNTQ